MTRRRRLSYSVQRSIVTLVDHILVLPGIDGWSLFNRGIIPGLRAGGVAGEIEFYDWTRGFPHMLGNLTDPQLHADQANLLSERIQRTRNRLGDGPLWMIGHSGGAAMTLLTLTALAETPIVTGAILLAPAISPAFDIESALRRTTCGIWNFRSWGDLPILATGSLFIGNVDGRRSLAAGVRGFASHIPRPKSPKDDATHPSAPQLHEVPWAPAMLPDANFGGHFGCVNRRFIRRRVAPILVGR